MFLAINVTKIMIGQLPVGQKLCSSYKCDKRLCLYSYTCDKDYVWFPIKQKLCPSSYRCDKDHDYQYDKDCVWQVTNVTKILLGWLPIRQRLCLSSYICDKDYKWLVTDVTKIMPVKLLIRQRF